jgi:hypothetical protein
MFVLGQKSFEVHESTGWFGADLFYLRFLYFLYPILLFGGV